MALIDCPECSKQISDKVTVCPHCGYPFAIEENYTNTQKVKVTDIKINSSKIKIFIIGFILILLSVYIIYLYNKNIEKNTYISNLRLIITEFQYGLEVANSLSRLTQSVWSNAIRKKSDPKTNKYTIYNGIDFYDDFNIALLNLYADNDIKRKKSDLEETQVLINTLIKLLQNPPNELKNCYNDLNDLYNNYQLLVNLAINPSGNLNLYTSKINDAYSSCFLFYNKVILYIPDNNKP